MYSLANEKITQEWQQLIASENTEQLALILSLVRAHSEELAHYFYQVMLSEQNAADFLSHEQVKTRLSKSLQKWLINLYHVDENYNLAATLQQQITVGEIHARIKIPIHFVLRGARCLKEHFALLLNQQPLDPQQTFKCYQLYCDLIDIAMELMSQAYAISADKGSRSEEIYRLFSISQNIATERERQKAALLDWENKLMFEYTLGLNNSAQLPRLRRSDFGLWFMHKGAHAFHDYKETRIISHNIQQIDDLLLPQMTQEQTSPEEKQQLLRDIHEATQNIKFHLDEIFNCNNEMENGRDVLTRLLNRKFLPTVMNREIAYARTHNTPFSVVLLDVDHFKAINDTHGHEAGDLVLQQLSSLLLNTCRSGDFIFRMGGEEFLLVLVDTDFSSAQMVAEKIRHKIAEELFVLPANKKIHVTASLGVALYDGHPDYEVLLRFADQALYMAKEQGRNQVQMHSSPGATTVCL